MRRKPLHRERPRHPDLALVFIRFVVEILEIGFSRNGSVDLFLPCDALLPPLGMQFPGFLRPFAIGLARNLPFLPLLFERLIQLLAQRFSQITSISALLAIDFSVMCGTRS
jgi:hypothetical protein